MVEAPKNTESRRHKFLRQAKYGVAALATTTGFFTSVDHKFPLNPVPKVHAEVIDNQPTMELRGFDHQVPVTTVESYGQTNTLRGGTELFASLQGSEKISFEGETTPGQNGTSSVVLAENHVALIKINDGAKGKIGRFGFDIHGDALMVVSGRDLSLDEQGRPLPLPNFSNRFPNLPAPSDGRDRAFIVFDHKENGSMYVVTVDKQDKGSVSQKLVQQAAETKKPVISIDLEQEALSVGLMDSNMPMSTLTTNWERTDTSAPRQIRRPNPNQALKCEAVKPSTPQDIQLICNIPANVSN